MKTRLHDEYAIWVGNGMKEGRSCLEEVEDMLGNHEVVLPICLQGQM